MPIEIPSIIRLNLKSKKLALVLFMSIFCYHHELQAQEDEDIGTEVVTIVKPYTPTISDAFKIKETPVLNDSITTTKKQVEYQIFSVPVASTFTPAKGRATAVEKAPPLTLYDNYATLGFGNYTTALAELFSNFQLSRTDDAGFFFRHNSSQGDIDGVFLENKYYDTALDGHYKSRQKEFSFGVNAGVQHQIFHWYGINEQVANFDTTILQEIDPKQTYFSALLGGELNFNDGFFEGITADAQFTADGFSSSEIHLKTSPEFMFPLETFNLKVQGSLDYLKGKFERDYFNTTELSYGFLNTEIAPALVLVNDDLTLSLGVAAVLSLNTEASSSRFFLYPRINLSYRLVDEILIAYGGADGGLRQNSYHAFKDANPFVSPTLSISPTDEKFDVFGGFKGKISNAVGYNLRASYRIEDNKALFLLNPYKGRLPDLEGYEYGNSFGLVYDQVNTLSVFGELKVEISEKFSLGTSATINSYAVDATDGEAWNLPDITATLFANFDITEKIYGGASLFYVGERQSFLSASQGGIIIEPFQQKITLDAYLDAKTQLGYRVSDRLSIFAKGSNLLGENYQKWLNYPVQGIQGLLGATYKFDW